MPKRKSRGRRKGRKGRTSSVQCSSCGKKISRDKAIRRTKQVPWLDARIAKELKGKGAYLPRSLVTKYYCVSCAVHRHITSPRRKEERKKEILSKQERQIKEKEKPLYTKDKKYIKDKDEK